MLFNSWAFAVFLPAILLCYYALPRKYQNGFLVLASYFFYGWWDYRFCSLLIVSTVVDFLCAQRIAGSPNHGRRKLYLFLSCFVNLGILGFFKYYNFFTDSFREFFATLGLGVDMPTLYVILPVGISFYTFQTLSYTIDVYRGATKPTTSICDFALYVCYFPQLVAGPIERSTRLLPQIQSARVVTGENISSGCVLILIGLFRKVAIADGVAPLVNQVFANPHDASGAQLLIGLYAFSLQIYGDFAGYSDIARGTSRLLGIELMENFQHPYFSTSITEFWRRWHISLSTWLRDYLYIPLGGNRHGRFNTYRNLMVTMLLGGLWHGAAWTFVAWGALHGIYLAVHKLLLGDAQPDMGNRSRPLRVWPGELAKMALTFHLVALTWLFFRAPDFATAWAYLGGILRWADGGALEGVTRVAVSAFLILAIDAVQYHKRRHTAILHWPWPVRGVAYACLMLFICKLRNDGDVPFIYFQF